MFIREIVLFSRTQLFVGARGTANLEEKRARKKNRDQGGFLSRSKFIRLKKPGYKHTVRGNREGLRGN